MTYDAYIGGERGERGERGRHGERGERGSRGWGGWGGYGYGWGGYGWPGYGGYYGGYGGVLDLPAGRVLAPTVYGGYGGAVLLGQETLLGQAPVMPPMAAPAAPPALPFPPRAALVDAPPPTFAARDILPLSTGVPILPTQSAQITGRPQARAFRGDRLMVSNAGTAGGAADWIINDIKIGNRSQFVQSGDVPGDLFAVNAIDTFVRFETAQTAMDIVVVVTYIGLNESGAPFFAALVGTAAI